MSRYRFCALFKEETLEATLVRFLKQKDAQLTEKDKVFLAAIAYWLPFAMREEPNCSPRELKQYALTSVYRLQQHINYLIQSFALEESALIVAPTSNRGEQREQISLQSTKELNSPIANSDNSTTATVEQPSDLLHSCDDGIFEEMFS